MTPHVPTSEELFQLVTAMREDAGHAVANDPHNAGAAPDSDDEGKEIGNVLDQLAHFALRLRELKGGK